MHVISGELKERAGVIMTITFRIAPDNPVVRFRYGLSSTIGAVLTKSQGRDQLEYLELNLDYFKDFYEVTLSEFHELPHMHVPGENKISNGDFTNGNSFMGPIMIAESENLSALLSYEHGSQLPDRYLEFALEKDKSLKLRAVKGNYYNGLELKPGEEWESVWMNLALVPGNKDLLASKHRDHILKWMADHNGSRFLWIYYNTWNNQERNHDWHKKPYLYEMNRARMLQEIETAHQMGVDVFVIDAGWFGKTGDWEASLERIPDDLHDIKARLDSLNMKLGLWFNSDAAISSKILDRNKSTILSWEGRNNAPHSVWETEESHTMCMVSSFCEDFAKELIWVAKKYGLMYFKWDAFVQYGCNSAAHHHGTEKNSPEERSQSYSFQLPYAMAKVATQVCEAIPGAVVDFDVTESERAFGLAFLSAGKYFTVNKGPYYYSFDDPEFAPGGGMGANVMAFPGLARAANARKLMDFDRWIPSVLFLTHYLPDDPEYSQWLNIGSLILGQNGIWGDLLSLSDEGKERFALALDKYKQLRDDITLSYPLRTGQTGGSPEIHEKISDETGKGVVVIFYNYKNAWIKDPQNAFPGRFTYVTEYRVSTKTWSNDDSGISFDKEGRAVITASFKGPGAKIVFFGVD